MQALILTIFVSAALVVAFVLFFVWSVRRHTFDHADRLALLPLDDASPASPQRANASDAKRPLRTHPKAGR